MTSSVAVVTGGARGIGAATVSGLRRAGHTVVAGDLTGDPDDARVPLLDVTDGDSRERFRAWILAQHGGVDVLVNNAGVNDRRAAADAGWDEWRALLDVNLGGVLEMSRAFRPHLAHRKGCIVNVASTGGHVAIAGAAAYGVSKAAVLHLTRILAVEWAPDVRVNSVSPTLVPTAMTADVLSDDRYMRAKLATIPLGAVPEAEDVADAVAFLCSRQARHITAADLPVDGGVTAL